MMREAYRLATAAGQAAALGLLLACRPVAWAQQPMPADETQPIMPVPLPAPADAGKVRLGERLFHEPRLSGGDRVTCAACHRLDGGGDDGVDHAPGSDGQPLDFNTPTIFNATLNARLNWRGNFRVLEEQNEQVLLDPRLMNTTWPELLGKLRADFSYVAAFMAAYGAPPERTHVLDALAIFQRSLLTPHARFDRWLRGEHDAISAEEKRGYELFQAYGCIACHQGVNIGGNLFQKFGIFENPFAWRSRTTTADLGRMALTGDPNDRHVFRVPSLRNVARTAPYFHDGSTATLEEAVTLMARTQLGRRLQTPEVDAIVKFLGTLSGEPRSRPP